MSLIYLGDNMPNRKKEIDKIEQCVQSQESLNDQLNILYFVANKLGLYDAAYYVRPDHGKLKMTEIEAAEIITEQDGHCYSIHCLYCPAERIRKEKGFNSCIDLWNNDDIKKKPWFENWLKENGDKMKTEKIKELLGKLQNTRKEQIEQIEQIIEKIDNILCDKVVDPEQHIIDAHDECNSRINYTDEENLFAKKVNDYSNLSKAFYAGFKAGEKYGEKYKYKGTLK